MAPVLRYNRLPANTPEVEDRSSVLSALSTQLKPREARREVHIPSRMRSREEWIDVCIRNISSRGLLVECSSPPSRGSYVDIRRGSQVIIGRVVWSKAGRFGVRTQDRLDIDAIINEPRLAQRPIRPTASERRNRSRAGADADITSRLERNRWRSSIMQFVLIVVGVIAASALIATAVHDVLASPLAAIERALSPAQ